MLQLLVTDQSLSHHTSAHESEPGFVRVLLYSNQALCNKFFNGISPTNLYRENTTRLMLERYIRQICRYNVIIDAIVEKLEVPGLSEPEQIKNVLGGQSVLRLVSCRLKPL